jgi:hypothetical protein
LFDGEPIQLFAQAGAIEESFVSPEVQQDTEAKFYPEEIVAHSLPPANNTRRTQSHTSPTMVDFPHDQNTDDPLLAFGKFKKVKGQDMNTGNAVPNLIANYALANDLNP